MASLEQLIGGALQEAPVHASATNGTAAIDTATPGADEVIVVVGITISANGAPAAGVAVTLTTDPAGTPRTLWAANIPNAAFAPIDINFKNPLPGDKGKLVRLSLPALGAAIEGRVSIRYGRKQAA